MVSQQRRGMLDSVAGAAAVFGVAMRVRTHEAAVDGYSRTSRDSAEVVGHKDSVAAVAIGRNIAVVVFSVHLDVEHTAGGSDTQYLGPLGGEGVTLQYSTSR